MTTSTCIEFIEFIVDSINKTASYNRQGTFVFNHRHDSFGYFAEITHYTVNGGMDWRLVKSGPNESLFRELAYEVGAFGIVGSYKNRPEI